MKRGRKFLIYGAYGSKAAARKKERAVHGFIVERKVRGSKRYVVLKRKKR
jgi:hypothetical protein